MPIRRTTANLVFLLGATLACASSADPHGVDSYDDADLFQLSIKELMQVSITGSTRSEQPISTVPAAVTVFTHEEIDRLGVDFLHELLAFVPGYQSSRTADSSNSSTYSSRGRRNSSQAREILLLIDGRPLHDPRTGGTNTTIRQLPLQQFERVEVIRGPGSAVYGSNAFTGVINLVSRRRVNEVRVAAGSFDRAQLQGMASAQHGNWQLDVFAFGDRDSGDDYRAADGMSGGNQIVETQDPRQLQHIDLRLQYADTALQLQHRRDHTEDFYAVGTISDDFNDFVGEHNQLTLSHSSRWRDDLKSQWQIDFVQARLDVDSQSRPAGALAAISNPPGITTPLQGKVDSEGERLALHWHNEWQIDAKKELQFGAEWTRDEETSARLAYNYDLLQLLAGTIPVNYYGNFDHDVQYGTGDATTLASAYGQYQTTLREHIYLTLGLREDHSDLDSRLSPRLGLVQQLNPQHSIKLLYGEAFRSPALTETGLINNRAIIGNPNLNNEVVKTLDLIWVAQWQQTGLSAGVFHNHYVDPIIAGFIGSRRTYINGDDENSHGAELELHHQINAHWMMGATWTALYNLPDSAYREADHFSSLMLNYQNAAWSWNIGAIYQSERDMLTPPAPGVRLTLDDYWLVQTKLSYAPTRHWQLSLQAKNALDDDYSTPVDSNNLPHGIPARSRELLLGVRYTN